MIKSLNGRLIKVTKNAHWNTYIYELYLSVKEYLQYSYTVIGTQVHTIKSSIPINFFQGGGGGSVCLFVLLLSNLKVHEFFKRNKICFPFLVTLV